MRCQKCNNTATLHITEVLEDDDFQELHLCEMCAHKHLYEPQGKTAVSKAGVAESGTESEEASILPQKSCPHCELSFVEFRNTGRLGCPNDYYEFRDELLPLLENIHGETKHCGKTPRRSPHTRKTQTELMNLRNQLKQAISEEDYEHAAALRDQIKDLEES
ncbi:MAG: UvrB/UvrC motif-containing protein [Gemmataceae bacterium]